MQGEAAEIKKAPRGILSMQLQIKKKKKEFSFLSEYAYDRSVNHIREHTSKTSHILLISNIYLEKERGNGEPQVLFPSCFCAASPDTWVTCQRFEGYLISSQRRSFPDAGKKTDSFHTHCDKMQVFSGETKQGSL